MFARKMIAPPEPIFAILRQTDRTEVAPLSGESFKTSWIPGSSPGMTCGGGARQFRALSTSLFLAIHGIMARSFSPICSIGCSAWMRRVALKEG
jgi:hypothetical protein